MSDTLKVKLLEYTPNGEKLIASAAKLCYSAAEIEDLYNGLTEEKVTEFLGRLESLGHASPVEHVSMTFAIEGVSRSLTHQLVRHRIASYSQVSQRYVKLSQFEYIIPPRIDNDYQLAEVFVEAMEKSQEAYDILVDGLMENIRQDYISRGMDEDEAIRKAEKEALEDARYVFPNACSTKIIMTMNIRSLLHFIQLRSCYRAQWEIRNLAIEILKQGVKVYPNLFRNAGPGCVQGPCPEGAMSCGRCREVRRDFKELTGGCHRDEN